MKHTKITLLGMLVAGSAAAYATCADLSGCEKKLCEMKAKLATVSEPHAKARIQAAIEATQASCTDKTAAVTTPHDAQRAEKKARKIADVRDDIAEAKRKKAKAQSEGKADKVRKYQHKIEEKERKLKDLDI